METNYSEMNGESKFWLRVWQSVILGFVAFIISLSSCNMYEKKQIADVIKTGVDPIEARMALSGQDTTTVQMITKILSEQKK